jgi:hypothetical protein
MNNKKGAHLFEFTLILEEREVEVVMMCEYSRFIRLFNSLQSLALHRPVIAEILSNEEVKTKISIFKL